MNNAHTTDTVPPRVSPDITVGNIASIITTLLSIMGGVWWISGELQALKGHDQLLDKQVTDLQTSDARMLGEREIRRKTTDEKFEFLFRERERMTKLETQMDFVFQSVKRIESKLDGK